MVLKNDLEEFLLWVGVVILKELIFNSSYFAYKRIIGHTTFK